MEGLGFLIWQLGKMPPALNLAQQLHTCGVRWVSIKVADAEECYNKVGGNDKILRDEYMAALRSVGIKVGGWQYVYPWRCGPQGARAAERIEKLELDHLLVNAEVEWKQPGLRAEVNLYLNAVDVNLKYHLSLCSYRRPDLHSPFPFNHFLNHDKIKSVTPQVYFLGAHNGAEQTARSYNEYRKLTDKPFYPIGPTFGWRDWNPTHTDLIDFRDYALTRAYRAYGFYSLDWIYQYNRLDWLYAIAGVDYQEPEDPPVPDSGVLRVSNCTALNFRSSPVTSSSNLVGSLAAGRNVTDLGETSGKWRKVRVQEDVWMHGNYLLEI